ncbi:MAG: DUF2905 domain-containing protein [Candidatus Scalindua sp.]|nr:DUF2905 domain-containing protein [Candidatus Scalindua sp.]
MIIPELGKLLIFLGILLVVIGLIVIMGNNFPFLGKLPGDIIVEKKGFVFYFPVVTCIMVSIILSVIFWLFGRR